MPVVKSDLSAAASTQHRLRHSDGRYRDALTVLHPEAPDRTRPREGPKERRRPRLAFGSEEGGLRGEERGREECVGERARLSLVDSAEHGGVGLAGVRSRPTFDVSLVDPGLGESLGLAEEIVARDALSREADGRGLGPRWHPTFGPEDAIRSLSSQQSGKIHAAAALWRNAEPRERRAESGLFTGDDGVAERRRGDGGADRLRVP